MLLRTTHLRTAQPLSWASRTRYGAMPLKARITNPEITAQRFAMSTEVPKELPGDQDNDVVFGTKYGVRTIELNRPDKLNSLNGSMARKIFPRLVEWEKSQLANVIIMKGAGRAFCAGGDVAALAKQNKQGEAGQQESKDYFALEYKLDHLIATYPKPYVAFMDGITMGGGVGLSVHAPFRIATEKTVFAMPETTIGFFPDVGASFFLPRMDGEIGTYLALTSEQLKGVNAFYAGIATHYLDSSSLPDLEARLAELNFKDYTSLTERLRIINDTIEEFTTGIPHDVPMQVSGNTRAAIDYCFQPRNDINAILSALDETHNAPNAPEDVRVWAEKTKSTILSRSPTSVKVALKQMRTGARWNIATAFRNEYAIASAFMEHADFVEGVSARLINRPPTKPAWSRSSLDDVTDQEVEAFFERESTLELLRHGPAATYDDYPHAWTGLPREREVERVVRDGQIREREAVVQHFVQAKKGKMGVREKVEEILTRKTGQKQGALVWDPPAVEAS